MNRGTLMNIYLSQAFTPRELTDMALALCDPIDLGNATPEELDHLVLAYFAEID